MDVKFCIYLLGLLGVLCGFGGPLNEGALNFESNGTDGTVDLQEHIAGQILRLHVIANSDLDADQELKLEVKDEIVALLREDLKGAGNLDEAKGIIESNLGVIEDTAEEVMTSHGYGYKANARIGWFDFPVKMYGDLTFPAGCYQALRVELGAAEGKNWWCVMFPSLCYVDEAHDVITKENKEKFKKILTEEEYQSLLNGKDSQVFYKSKFKIVIHNFVDYFSESE